MFVEGLNRGIIIGTTFSSGNFFHVFLYLRRESWVELSVAEGGHRTINTIFQRLFSIFVFACANSTVCQLHGKVQMNVRMSQWK